MTTANHHKQRLKQFVRHLHPKPHLLFIEIQNQCHVSCAKKCPFDLLFFDIQQYLPEYLINLPICLLSRVCTKIQQGTKQLRKKKKKKRGKEIKKPQHADQSFWSKARCIFKKIEHILLNFFPHPFWFGGFFFLFFLFSTQCG